MKTSSNTALDLTRGAEDRFMGVWSRRRTSARGQDLPVDMCALLHRLSDQEKAFANA